MLPEIISSNYSNEKYFFMSANTQRTKGSYLAFMEGLFDTQNIPNPLIGHESDEEIDMLLRVCPQVFIYHCLKL